MAPGIRLVLKSMSTYAPGQLLLLDTIPSHTFQHYCHILYFIWRGGGLGPNHNIAIPPWTAFEPAIFQSQAQWFHLLSQRKALSYRAQMTEGTTFYKLKYHTDMLAFSFLYWQIYFGSCPRLPDPSFKPLLRRIWSSCGTGEAPLHSPEPGVSGVCWSCFRIPLWGTCLRGL